MRVPDAPKKYFYSNVRKPSLESLGDYGRGFQAPTPLREDIQMIVDRKTRDINRYLTHLQAGQVYYLGLPAGAHVQAKLAALGFSVPLVAGERLLPLASKGAASRRNANGYEIVHRDQPMEVAYRQISWTWTEFHGRDNRVERTEVKEVPYRRYPRTKIAPYSVELQIYVRADGTCLAAAGPFRVSNSLDAAATNTANMLIEQIGAYQVLDDAFTAAVTAPIRRLNWHLLPPGRNPWQSARAAVARVVAQTGERNRVVTNARFEAIGGYHPQFVAIGLGGFDGYVVFGFPRFGFCVLESRQVNNATYVLRENDWEAVSQFSKAEILSESAHRARLVHRSGWFDELANMLAPPSRDAA
ncbi:hypothetical protein SAMN05414139_05451 [Burkholderia sp. D7]|nr:hypothetical protein SAMN05414139_05451 [Burkholderia sp. D7]